VDEVREAALSCDLHNRDPLAVFSLERWVAVDRDLAKLEAEFVTRRGYDSPRCLAEVTARGRVEDDLDAQRISSSRARTASNAWRS
jgi:hypothetical protein